MSKNIEIQETGLQCDNTSCDWKDETINYDTYKDWLNKPCPKCGENVLTEQDYKNAEAIRLSIEIVNSLSPEQLEELNKSLGIHSLQDLKNMPMFKNTQGLDDVNEYDEVSMTVSLHKEIKVEKIKNLKN